MELVDVYSHGIPSFLKIRGNILVVSESACSLAECDPVWLVYVAWDAEFRGAKLISPNALFTGVSLCCILRIEVLVWFMKPSLHED